jgi:hypothetical protein
MVVDERAVAPGRRRAINGLRAVFCRGIGWNVRAGFTTTVSLVVIVQFASSSFAHLSNPYYFLSSIYSYQLVDRTSGVALAVLLPFLQIVITLCLLLRVFVPAAFALAAFMFSSFYIAQGLALWRGLRIGCGCFGTAGSDPISYQSFGTAVVVGSCCFVSLLMTRSACSAPNENPRLEGAEDACSVDDSHP